MRIDPKDLDFRIMNKDFTGSKMLLKIKALYNARGLINLNCIETSN
jgi:hypothetical protein